MSHSKQAQRRPFVSKATSSCRSPGGLPQASRDSYLASCLHEFYFPRCGVRRLDKGTGKRIVLVALKIASAQEDWRSNLCSHFQQSSSCCCDKVFTFAIGFRQQKDLAESDGDTSMTTTSWVDIQERPSKVQF